jgi:hypothetical protein
MQIRLIEVSNVDSKISAAYDNQTHHCSIISSDSVHLIDLLNINCTSQTSKMETHNHEYC